MSLHTGIEPSKEIDVDELNIPTKKYVDDAVKLKLGKSGGTLTGGLSMDDNKITDLGTPTANTHASTKKYVDEQAALKLDLAGGQMTGPLGLGNGRLWDVETPTLDTNGANKKYVDDKASTLQTSINGKLAKTGGTLTGELSMYNNKITDLATPTDNTDAANKKYVDDNASSNIVVKDASYTTKYVPMKKVRIGGSRLNTDLDSLLNATITHPKIFTIRLSFNNSTLAAAFSNGKSALVWGKFNSLSGSVLKASVSVGNQSHPFTKLKLMYSNNSGDIIGTTGDISDEISGTFGQGQHIIPVSSQKFTNMTYLLLYFEVSPSLGALNFLLDTVFIC